MTNRNAHYWRDSDVRAERAAKHMAYMMTHWNDETERSIAETKVYYNCPSLTETGQPKRYDRTKETLLCVDTITAILKTKYTYDEILTDSLDGESRILCALNFASFKHPGGKFLEGSCAQEEMLCHESNLYNILVQMYDVFYNENKKLGQDNRHLYQDSLLYTPNVIIERKEEKPVTCDIITCAAPNAHAAKKYCQVHPKDILYALSQRILGILKVAKLRQVDDLIVGAFGCGVFGNNPYTVASIFRHYIHSLFDGYFDHVIYAVPDSRSINYKAFEQILTGSAGNTFDCVVRN